MKRVFQILCLVVVFTSFIFPQLVIDSIVVADQINPDRTLYFGMDPLATAGIDLIFGESYLPPFPPPGAYDARLYLPENNFSGSAASWRDYRFMDSVPLWGTKEFHIAWQLGTGSPGLRITYALQPRVTGLLQDLFGGVLVNVNISGSGVYNVPNPAITQLKMFITYDSTVAVELTSFGATVNGSSVALNWQTASEINNRGFEIERKSPNTNWENIGFVAGVGNSTSAMSYSYVDANVTGTSFKYRLKQIDFDGTFEYSKEVEVDLNVKDFNLYQNYPNPFNPSTKIKFSVPQDGMVTVKVYNMLGQEIVTLFADNASAGVHTLNWNGKDASGIDVSSGSYICKMTAGNFIQSNKMILIK